MINIPDMIPMIPEMFLWNFQLRGFAVAVADQMLWKNRGKFFREKKRQQQEWKWKITIFYSGKSPFLMVKFQQRGSDWDIVNKMLGCWATQAPKTQFVAWEGLETSWQILAKVVGWNICHEGGQKTWNKPWQTCLIRTKQHWWNIGAFPTIQNSQCCGNFILNPQIFSFLDGLKSIEEPHCWHLMVQYSPIFNPNDIGVPIWVGKQIHVCWLECQSINRWFSIWWFKQSTKSSEMQSNHQKTYEVREKMQFTLITMENHHFY